MPDRLFTLTRIIQALLGAESWKDVPFNVAHAEHATRYLHEAKALVELLEIHDCGSTGGYDKEAKEPVTINLLTRTNWLINKYNQMPELPIDIRKQWKSLLAVHNKYYAKYKHLKV